MIQLVPSSPAAPQARPRKRRSRLEKVLLVFGFTATGTVLLCCVTSLLFHPDLVTTGADIDSIARKFGSLKIPASFKGVIGASADNAVMWIQIARFDQKEGRGKLVIGGVYLRRSGSTPEHEAIAEKFDAIYYDTLLNKLVPKIRLLDVLEKRDKTVNVHGKAVTFEIVSGEDRASTTRLRQVTGTFPGPVGMANLLIQVEEGFITDQEIDEFLESLSDLTTKEEPPTAANLNSK